MPSACDHGEAFSCRGPVTRLTRDHVTCDGAARRSGRAGTLGSVLQPSREVLGDSDSQPAFGASNITASAVTRELIDAVGHTVQGNRVLGREAADRRCREDHGWEGGSAAGKVAPTVDRMRRTRIFVRRSPTKGIRRKAVIFSGPKNFSDGGLGVLCLAT